MRLAAGEARENCPLAKAPAFLYAHSPRAVSKIGRADVVLQAGAADTRRRARNTSAWMEG